MRSLIVVVATVVFTPTTIFVSCVAMKPGRSREDDGLRRGLTRWAVQHWPDRSDVRVTGLVRPRSGWSNETLIVGLAGDDGPERVVVRLPPLVPSFPVYDLDA